MRPHISPGAADRWDALVAAGDVQRLRDVVVALVDVVVLPSTRKRGTTGFAPELIQVTPKG